ncbi:ABC transporter ATP-binding protein [Micromonospora endolithica]|uniref:ABC transporter ATP-binding protein n=1 Tax=Micromonospora endolithica TaxID=230091 RepID=A0A3A9ZHX7_9ACTN|nr:ABC transporter ATP-binding protein [Micromonospora endolithica]RKN47883.1 ABC transporter ATP-binding protein [Micromonospora endolithica]TWJ21582.1 NitT/TauT family transport system ATP-binding protein [Micromonospora endolithica]
MAAGTPVRTGTAIDLSGVSVRFTSKRSQTTALDDVSLRIAPGEFVTIVGPSGCGKSTLLKIVAGLVRPTSGDVSLMGRPVAGPQKDIGFVFQRAALLEWRGARANILLQAEMRGMDRRAAAQRADGLIEMTGLRGFEKALPHELSGGMQQRVALCRALLHSPPVLLMDEPFGALDALTRESMNAEMNRIWRDTGTTVVLVTHSIAEAVFLGTRVVVMSPRPGRILRTFDVDLPAHRDYAQVMSDARFDRLATELRGLLGSVAAH